MEVESQAGPSGVEHSGTAPSSHDGFRAEAFRQSYLLALKHSLRALDFGAFTRAFPGFPPALMDALYDVYQQALLLIRANAEMEFENILGERALVDKLHALDALCVGQGLLPGQQGAPPPESRGTAHLFPEAQLRAYANGSKEEEVKRLRKMLEDLEGKKAAMASENASKRAAVQQAIEAFKPVGTALSELHGLTQP